MARRSWFAGALIALGLVLAAPAASATVDAAAVARGAGSASGFDHRDHASREHAAVVTSARTLRPTAARDTGLALVAFGAAAAAAVLLAWLSSGRQHGERRHADYPAFHRRGPPNLQFAN